MKFSIYSKSDCPHCYKIKQVLELTGRDFTVYTLDEDFNKKDFYSQFGEGSTFPQVQCDQENLGGCVDTIRFLKKHQIV